MEITWYGHSCFRITERGLATVVTDPFDHQVVGYDALKLKADVVTVSHAAPGHSFTEAVKGMEHVLNGPGEYEIGGVYITGIQTTRHNSKDTNPRNTMFVFDYDGITVAHLGDLSTIPTQSEIESAAAVNIALLPVGDGTSLNAARAAEVISLIEPNVVIPMHYATPHSLAKLDPLDKFLKEMGLSEVEEIPSFKVSALSALPEETRVTVLQYARG